MSFYNGMKSLWILSWFLKVICFYLKNIILKNNAGWYRIDAKLVLYYLALAISNVPIWPAK